MTIDRLAAGDRIMLQWERRWPQDVGAIAVLDGSTLLDRDGKLLVDVLRKAIQARLHLIPRLRQVIHFPRRGLGGPLWQDSADFDLGCHLRVRTLPADSGDAELLREIEAVRRRPLDLSRPPWEMWLLPGLRDRRIGLFVRMHHAIGDGRAAMTMLAAFVDPVADAPNPSAPAWSPAPLPSAAALVGDNLLRRIKGFGHALFALARPWRVVGQVLGVWPAMRELLAEEPASETSLDRIVGADRNLGVVRTTVDEVRRVARAHGATVNDLLLAMTAGGLRALLRSRGEPVDGVTMRIYVPVSLRGRLRGTVQGNRISQMVVPLPIGESDPRIRLRQIAAETARRKASSRPELGVLFQLGIVSRLMLKAIIRQRVNVTSASIPGPRRPAYLAGARMLELFPMLNLLGNQPLGVGAVSYAGTFNIGVVADRDAYPDLDTFVVALRSELDALRANVASAGRAAA